jgi:hypothetical protein
MKVDCFATSLALFNKKGNKITNAAKRFIKGNDTDFFAFIC